MRIKRRKLTSKSKRNLTTVAARIPANLSTITPLQPFCSPFYGVLNLDKSKWLRCYRATSRKPWPPGNKVYVVKPRGRYASPYHLPVRYVDTESKLAAAFSPSCRHSAKLRISSKLTIDPWVHSQLRHHPRARRPQAATLRGSSSPRPGSSGARLDQELSGRRGRVHGAAV